MSAKVQIIGNLGRDPETRVNANNTFIANFSFASNNQRKSAKGETIKKADWYNITATGKQAQILAKHVRKGDPLLIEGRQRSASGLTAKEESANRLMFSCRIFVSSERATVARTKIKPCRKQQAAKSLTISAKRCTPRRTT